MSHAIHLDVARAIARSIEHNEIATLRALDEAEFNVYCRTLFDESEDCADNDQVAEYWGVDMAGNEWRVHVLADWIDSTPYCSYGHRTKASCDCGPIAENE